ncbi:MAG: histidinol-phosphate aminotransferase family protein [Methanolinea sp.]|nr:histidinol-phosphate aminotransferase family protein [Methanolinea sp.]
MEGDTPEKVIHGGTARRIEAVLGARILDFSASLNPAPPAIPHDLPWDHLTSYPDDSYTTLRETISGLFGRSVREIAIGNGSIEILRIFCAAVFSPGDRYVTFEPTFGEYDLSARLAGADRNGNGPVRVTFLCNPNNPTGTLVSRDTVLSVLDRCRQEGGILFLDEAFIELSDDPSQSLADLRDPHLFVLRSLTKSYSVPGIRFGFGFGDPSLVKRLEILRPPWSVNAFAETIALEAFRHTRELDWSRRIIREEREWIIGKLRPFSIHITPSQTNFLLLTFPYDVAPLCNDLLEHGVLVRDCHSFGLPCSIRIAVRTREENERLIEAFSACLH